MTRATHTLTCAHTSYLCACVRVCVCRGAAWDVRVSHGVTFLLFEFRNSVVSFVVAAAAAVIHMGLLGHVASKAYVLGVLPSRLPRMSPQRCVCVYGLI